MSSIAGLGFLIGLRPPRYLRASLPAALTRDDDDEADMFLFFEGRNVRQMFSGVAIVSYNEPMTRLTSII